MEFKKLIRLFTPMIVDGVISIRRDAKARLVDKLHELEFITRSATQNVDSVVIELQILDVDLLNQLLAGEANRFLLASRLSEERATQNQVGNAAWQAVEHYYAAYYGVHYLLRLTGVSLTNLDEKASKAIEKSSIGAPLTFSLPTGLYVMRYDKGSCTLTLTKNTKRKSGGSHQDAWRLWAELIDKLRQKTNVDLVEYASTAVDLAMHKSFLIKSTAKYSPPEIRGEINYQFKGGAWIFESKATESIAKIHRLITSEKPPKQIDVANAEGLIASNRVIIDFAKGVFIQAAENYPKSICRSIANKYSSCFPV